MPTRRPLETSAVAIKMPKVPPQTNTSNMQLALSPRSEWNDEPLTRETTSWISLAAKEWTNDSQDLT